MQKNKYIEEDSISIIALLKGFWIARKTILKITLLFFFIGLFVAVFSKNTYRASTTFVPLVQGKSSGNIGGLASLAGISLGGGVNNSEISPDLYPQIIESYPYQKELLETPLTIKGQKNPISYKSYYKDVYSPSVLEYFKKYTIGLPSVIIGLFRSKSDDKVNTVIENESIKTLSATDVMLTNKLSNQIDLQVNSKDGFISISVIMEEPLAAAQLALKAQEVLQKYALHFKTQKSIEQLNYIKARYLEKEKEFNAKKINLARFQDRNIGVNTALGRTKLLKLKSDYDLSFRVYSELASQLESQRLQVKKDTPLFTVLKPVIVPYKKFTPRRVMILVMFFFVGFLLSIAYVLGKRFFIEFKQKWQSID